MDLAKYWWRGEVEVFLLLLHACINLIQLHPTANELLVHTVPL